MSSAEQLPPDADYNRSEAYWDLDAPEFDQPGQRFRLISGEVEYPLDEQTSESLPPAEASIDESSASFLPGDTAIEVLNLLPPDEFQKIHQLLKRYAHSRMGTTEATEVDDAVSETLLAFTANTAISGKAF